MLVRSSIAIIVMYLLLYSIAYVPLGILSILFNLAPFFTLIATFIILKEQLPGIEILNMVISFFGVTLVIFGQFNSTSTSESPQGS